MYAEADPQGLGQFKQAEKGASRLPRAMGAEGRGPYVPFARSTEEAQLVYGSPQLQVYNAITHILKSLPKVGFE